MPTSGHACRGTSRSLVRTQRTCRRFRHTRRAPTWGSALDGGKRSSDRRQRAVAQLPSAPREQRPLIQHPPTLLRAPARRRPLRRAAPLHTEKRGGHREAVVGRQIGGKVGSVAPWAISTSTIGLPRTPRRTCGRHGGGCRSRCRRWKWQSIFFCELPRIGGPQKGISNSGTHAEGQMSGTRQGSAERRRGGGTSSGALWNEEYTLPGQRHRENPVQKHTEANTGREQPWLTTASDRTCADKEAGFLRRVLRKRRLERDTDSATPEGPVTQEVHNTPCQWIGRRCATAQGCIAKSSSEAKPCVDSP